MEREGEKVTTLYDNPHFYETAHSFRDIPGEARFLRSCIARFSEIPVKRVLEIGCGHAPHAGELTALQFSYVGLDNNRNMLDYAAHRWGNLKPFPEFVEGNMVSFTLDKKADFTFVMLGSLYLNSLEEMTSHFDSIAAALHPGGLYFLDSCIQFADPLIPRATSVTSSEHNGIKVESRFDIRLTDSAQQMYEEVWTVDVNDHGQHNRLQLVEHNRAIFPQEFLLFIRTRFDFEFLGWWKDWDLSKPIEGENQVIRPIVLLKRK